jgi:hypothetical protein
MQEQADIRRTGLWGLIVFVATFLYFGALTFQGFDMTDEGHHLTKQMIWGTRESGRWDMLWLTHGVGWAWLKLFGGYGLLGARFAWVLTLSVTAAVAYRILKSSFRPCHCAVAVLAGAVACTYHQIMVISQNNLPFLFLLAAVGVLLAADRAEGKPGRQFGLLLLTGAALVIAVMARFPLVLGLPLLFVPRLVRSVQARRGAAREWLIPLAVVAVGCAAAAAAVACLGLAGDLRRQVVGAISSVGKRPEYTLTALGQLYAVDALRMGRLLGTVLIKFGPWAIGLHVVLRRFGVRRWAPVLLAVVAVGQYALAMREHGFWAVWHEYSLLLPGCCLLLALFEFCVGLAMRDRPGVARRQVLLAVAAAISLLIVAGTNNGLVNMMHGLWLLFPVVWLLLPETVEFVAARLRAQTDRRMIAAYAVCLAAVFVVLSAGIRLVNPYRDCRRRWQLRTDIGYGALNGVRTTESRARSVRELFARLDASGVTAGESVLAYGNIPMVHFVTKTIPALGNPWPFCLTEDELRMGLARLERGALPVVAVGARTDVGDGAWGRGRPIPFPAEAARKLDMLHQWLAAMGYEKVWTNADFEVLVRP